MPTLCLLRDDLRSTNLPAWIMGWLRSALFDSRTRWPRKEPQNSMRLRFVSSRCLSCPLGSMTGVRLRFLVDSAFASVTAGTVGAGRGGGGSLRCPRTRPRACCTWAGGGIGGGSGKPRSRANLHCAFTPGRARDASGTLSKAPSCLCGMPMRLAALLRSCLTALSSGLPGGQGVDEEVRVVLERLGDGKLGRGARLRVSGPSRPRCSMPLPPLEGAPFGAAEPAI
mmetsp:Transcript_20633/g.62770  ORF Transcript_20633/g.62770 Transcript_20633/m.62770 type:complete len:226 (+) Transcript_20633:741-1418(+)